MGDDPVSTDAPSNPSQETPNEIGSQPTINFKAELEKLSNHVMDRVDSRIEGVEETMVSMNRAIRRLSRKVT